MANWHSVRLVQRVGATTLMAWLAITTAQPTPVPLCPMRGGLVLEPAMPMPAAAAPTAEGHQLVDHGRRSADSHPAHNDKPFGMPPHPCACFGQCVMGDPIGVPVSPVGLRRGTSRADAPLPPAAALSVGPRRIDYLIPFATAPPGRT